MRRGYAIAVFTVSCIILLASCRKEPLTTEPPIESYRTYDLVTVAVKEDPFGGYVLLCKNTPNDARTSFLQFMNSTGDLGQRIMLESLPRTVENLAFTASEILYTDMQLRADGSVIVAGLGRDLVHDDRLYLIVHVIDRQGQPLSPPYRRFLTANAVEVLMNGVGDPRQDRMGLPRNRALAELCNDNMVVAARWETNTGGGIGVYRFPLPGSNDPPLETHLTLTNTDRLHALACDPASGQVVVVADSNAQSNTYRTRVFQYSPSASSWGAVSRGTLGPLTNAEPTELTFRQGRFTLIGYAPEAQDVNEVKPFLINFQSVSGSMGQGSVLATSQQVPVVAYCSNWWNGQLQLLTNVHESTTLAPFFIGDITSDLLVSDVSPSGPSIANATSVIPGQGLRPIGYFTEQGARVVIGSQHPYLNAGLVHTFFLVLDN